MENAEVYSLCFYSSVIMISRSVIIVIIIIITKLIR